MRSKNGREVFLMLFLCLWLVTLNVYCNDDECHTEDCTTWLQYDDRWGSMPLGVSGLSVSSHGCLVTSVAILLGYSGLTESDFLPSDLFTYLSDNGGWDTDGNFVWTSINGYTNNFKYIKSIKLTDDLTKSVDCIKKLYDNGYYIVANVEGTSSSGHWVAVLGYSDEGIIMADPASNSTILENKYSNIKRLGLFYSSIKSTDAIGVLGCNKNIVDSVDTTYDTIKKHMSNLLLSSYTVSNEFLNSLISIYESN